MKKLTNNQANQLSVLAKKAEKKRKLEKQCRALKKECEALTQELESVAKNNKDTLKNGEFVVSFIDRNGGDFYTPKWKRYGVDKVISL